MVAFIRRDNNSVLRSNTFHRSRKILLTQGLYIRSPSLTNTAARGMKNAAELSTKLLSNASKTYYTGSVNLARAIQMTRDQNSANVSKILSKFSNILESQPGLSSDIKDHVNSFLLSFELGFNRGLLVQLGNQWHVPRAFTQNSLQEFRGAGAYFKTYNTYYKSPEKFEEVFSQNKTFLVFLQPISDGAQQKWSFESFFSENKESFNFVKYTDLVGYGGEASMGAAISKLSSTTSLVMSPNSGKNYPFVDYLHTAVDADRNEQLFFHFGQSKASENPEGPNFNRMTDLSYPELELVASSVRNSLIDTANQFGKNNLGIPEAIDLNDPLALQQLSIANTKFTFFASGFLGAHSSTSRSAEELDTLLAKKEVATKVSVYLHNLFGRGILSDQGSFSFEAALNSINGDFQASPRNYEACVTLSQSVSFIRLLASSSQNFELYFELMRICSLDSAIEAIVKNTN